jgi:hypothetical protein
MAGELERIHTEASDLLRKAGGIQFPQNGLSPEAKAVRDEAGARATAISAAYYLAAVADALDGDLAECIHRNVLKKTAAMEEEEKQYTSQRLQAVGTRVTDLFSERHVLHATAYYYAFGEQATRQVVTDISPKPPTEQPPKRRFRIFRDGS